MSQLQLKPKEIIEKQKEEIYKNSVSLRNLEDFIENWFPNINKRKLAQLQLQKKNISVTNISNGRQLSLKNCATLISNTITTMQSQIQDDENEKIKQLEKNYKSNDIQSFDQENNNQQEQVLQSPLKIHQKQLRPTNNNFLKMVNTKLYREKKDFKDLNTKQLFDELNNCFQQLQLSKLQNPEYYFDGSIFKFELSKILKQGQTLGGMEIINGKNHKETVVALSDCIIGFLNRQEFTEILKFVEEGKINKKIDILCKSFTQDVPDIRKTMNNLVQYLEKITIIKNQPIFLEGDLTKYVYIIKKGEISLQKASIIQPPKQFSEQNIYMKIPQKTQQVQISILNDGQFLGQNDVIELKKYNSQSAISLSSLSSLYKIPKQKFLKFINDNPQIGQIFKDRIQFQKDFSSTKFLKIEQLVKQEYQNKFIPLSEQNDLQNEDQIKENLKSQQYNQIQYSIKHGSHAIQERAKSRGAARDTFDKYSSVLQENNSNSYSQQLPTQNSELDQRVFNSNTKVQQNQTKINLKSSNKSTNQLKIKNSHNNSISNNSSPKTMKPVYQNLQEGEQQNDSQIEFNQNQLLIGERQSQQQEINQQINFTNSANKVERLYSESKPTFQRISSANKRNLNQDLIAVAVSSNYEKQVNQEQKRISRSRDSNRKRSTTETARNKITSRQNNRDNNKDLDILQYQTQNDTLAKTRMFLAANFLRKPYKQTLGVRMTTDGSLPFKCLFQKVKNEVIKNCKTRMETAPNQDKNDFVGPISKPYTPIDTLYCESYHNWSNPNLVRIVPQGLQIKENNIRQQFHTRSHSLYNTQQNNIQTNFVKTSEHFNKTKISNIQRHGQEKLNAFSFHKTLTRLYENTTASDIQFQALLSNFQYQPNNLINFIQENQSQSQQLLQSNRFSNNFIQNQNKFRIHQKNIRNSNDNFKKSIVIVNHMGKPIKYQH